MAFRSKSPSKAPSEELQSNATGAWLETLQTVGLSLILALGIRTLVAEARYIPSGSMLPTLEINDRLIIDKVSYRFKSPSRGDIVVFYPPAAAGKQFVKEAFIKRIIGLPGETIEIKNGQVYANGLPLDEAYTAAQPDYNWGPQVVPPNSYLVLGDNRNDSDDGHIWGFLPENRIIGRATLRFWPLNRLAYLADPSYPMR